MEFKITENDARKFAQIESSAGCDIGAGLDWGTSLREFLAGANSYVDHEKLVALLRDLSRPALDVVDPAFGVV